MREEIIWSKFGGRLDELKGTQTECVNGYEVKLIKHYGYILSKISLMKEDTYIEVFIYTDLVPVLIDALKNKDAKYVNITFRKVEDNGYVDAIGVEYEDDLD